MNVMRLINWHTGWSQCRVCGRSYCVERAPRYYRKPDYMQQFAWGAFSRLLCGCTQEMLIAKLRAEKEGRRLMAETSKRHWTEADKERAQAIKIAGAQARARRIEKKWEAEDKAQRINGGQNA